MRSVLDMAEMGGNHLIGICVRDGGRNDLAHFESVRDEFCAAGQLFVSACYKSACCEIVELSKFDRPRGDSCQLFAGIKIGSEAEWGAFAQASIEKRFSDNDITIEVLRCMSGTYPVFYVATHQYFVFSTVPSVLYAFMVAPTLSVSALVQTLAMGGLPDGVQLCEEINVLPPGGCVRIHCGQLEVSMHQKEYPMNTAFLPKTVDTLFQGSSEDTLGWRFLLPKDRPDSVRNFLEIPELLEVIGGIGSIPLLLKFAPSIHGPRETVLVSDLGRWVEARDMGSARLAAIAPVPLDGLFRSRTFKTQYQQFRQEALSPPWLMQLNFMLSLACQLQLLAASWGKVILFPYLDALFVKLGPFQRHEKNKIELQWDTWSGDTGEVHFTYDAPSAVNLFDSVQRLYRYGKSDTRVNQLLDLTPWKTRKLVSRPGDERSPGKISAAIALLSCDYLIQRFGLS